MSKFATLLERKIKGNIIAIRNKTKTIKEASVNGLIERLGEIDQASAEELQKSYIEAVKKINEEREDKKD